MADAALSAFVAPLDSGRERRILRYIKRRRSLTERASGNDLTLGSGVVERVVAQLLLAGRITIAEHDRYGDPCSVA